MLNLVVRIVTTAIKSMEVYRICMCYFFTKCNNNTAGCIHSIKRTSSAPTELSVYAMLSTVVTTTGGRCLEPPESATSLHCWDLHSSSVCCHSCRSIDQLDNGETPREITGLIKRSDVARYEAAQNDSHSLPLDYVGLAHTRPLSGICGR
jgi:hypothetical protein